MIMFASDLDRTLIYSKRALTEFNQDINNDLIGIEHKDDIEVAYMTAESFRALQDISKNILFVPVTTRTYDQFKRIFIFMDEIPLKYAVTSNGSNIIYKGKPLTEWNGFVQNRLRDECSCLEEMVEKLQEYNIKGNLKKADNLFLYYLLTEAVSMELKKEIREFADSNGWRISLQGRKLYLMPKPVCKGEAVKYIKDREGISTVIGAGDSLLDHDFLKVCDYPFVPSHGELIDEKIKGFDYIVSKNRGVKAGEEILFGISDILKERI